VIPLSGRLKKYKEALLQAMIVYKIHFTKMRRKRKGNRLETLELEVLT
jgi:hypothetical protein